MSSWAIAKLGQLVEIQSGHSPSDHELLQQGEYPFVKVEDLNNCNRIQLEARQYCENGRYSVPEGSVIFPKRGASIMTNKVRIAGRPILLDTNMMALIANNLLLDSDYLQYLLVHEKLFKIADISSIPQINNKHIFPYKVFLPQVEEQRQISSVLGYWDRAIDLIEKLLDEKQQLRCGLMHQLLTGKRRIPGFEGTKWVDIAIGKLFKEVNRPVEWDDSELYELISIRRRSGGLFHRDSLYGHQILTKSLNTAKTGDFLISKMQVLHGATGVVTKKFDGMKISDSYISIIPIDPDSISVDFFNLLSQMPIFRHLTYLASHGVHIEKMTFNFKKFLKSRIHIPLSIKEQCRISEVIRTVDKEIELLQAKADALREQKKGLMQQLLTGRKRIATCAS